MADRDYEIEMENEKKLRLREKASFYFKEKLICHITKEPKGVVNGWFRSELIDDTYFMFEDENYPCTEFRLFVVDIFDINDFKVKTW